MGHKVVFDEDPAPADLGPGNDSRFGALAKLFRVDAKKLSCFLQIKGTHRKASSGSFMLVIMALSSAAVREGFCWFVQIIFGRPRRKAVGRGRRHATASAYATRC